MNTLCFHVFVLFLYQTVLNFVLDFEGLAINVVLAANGSTNRLAELIISKFQGLL